MIFNPDDPENDKEDFFDGPDIPEPVRQPKRTAYNPDDPDYWEEESEWEHLRPKNKTKIWIWAGGSLLLILLLLWVWLRYVNPYVTDATQVGYVEHIESQGTFFKTYEGVLLPFKELYDTTRVYRRDFIFTADNEKTATRLKQAMLDGRPVRVGYKQYHATVPWRGRSKTIIVSVDSVDPSKILPPEFNPTYLKSLQK